MERARIHIFPLAGITVLLVFALALYYILLTGSLLLVFTLIAPIAVVVYIIEKIKEYHPHYREQIERVYSGYMLLFAITLLFIGMALMTLAPEDPAMKHDIHCKFFALTTTSVIAMLQKVLL